MFSIAREPDKYVLHSPWARSRPAPPGPSSQNISSNFVVSLSFSSSRCVFSPSCYLLTRGPSLASWPGTRSRSRGTGVKCHYSWSKLHTKHHLRSPLASGSRLRCNMTPTLRFVWCLRSTHWKWHSTDSRRSTGTSALHSATMTPLHYSRFAIWHLVLATYSSLLTDFFTPDESCRIILAIYLAS